MAIEFNQLIGTNGNASTLNATGTTAAVSVPPGENIAITLSIVNVTGTTPSATFEVQWSVDGVQWHSAETPDTFTAITAAKNVVKSFIPKGRLLRLSYTLSGTSPSFVTIGWVSGAVNSVFGA